MHQKCPHCHDETFGWRELVTLGAFFSVQCSHCHNWARNSGWRQLLTPLVFIVIFVATVSLRKFIPWESSALLIPISLLAFALCLALIATPVKSDLQQAELPAFTPNPENDKAIMVQGWNEDELRKILDDFVEQDLSAFTAFKIDIEQRSENSFVLTFPEDIHPDEFISLINYLAYPFGLDYAGRSIIVAAETTLNSDFDGLPDSLEGSKALLYLPENDKDYDVVYLQAESGAVFVKSLGDGGWRKAIDARLPNAVGAMSREDLT